MSTKSSENIVVSIQMITYNHEPFIAQAIEGVLMQKTTFKIKLIIGEDCSVDLTRKICEDYANKYPEMIHLLPSDKNLGMSQNGERTLQACTGKYIAFCEGDDYWTDPLKLQKQVDFMEENESFGIVHTNYRVVDANNQIIHKYNRAWSSGDVFEQIIKGKYSIVTATVIIRTQFYKKVEPELTNQNFKMGDLPVWIEMSRISKVKYLDTVTTSYRKLTNSASHSNDIFKVQSFHESVLNMKIFYCEKYKLKFNRNQSLSELYGVMIKECYNRNESSLVLNYYKKMVDSEFKSIFKFIPLLFMLGTRFTIFDKLIKALYSLNNTN